MTSWFAHNLRGKDDANKTHIQSDSPEGRTDSITPLVGLRRMLSHSPEDGTWRSRDIYDCLV